MKDYAKPQESAARPKRRIALWITAIIITLAIVLPVLMYYVRFQKTIHKKEPAITNQIPIPKISTKKEKKHQADDPQFDFYNLLSKKR